MKLALKLTVLALCIGVPLVASSMLFTRMTGQALELKIRERHQELAEHLAVRTDAVFTDFEKYISTFLYSYGTASLDDANLRKNLSILLLQNDTIRILTVTDSFGKVLIQTQETWETPPGEIAKHTESIRAEKVLKEPAIEFSGVYVSPADPDKLLITATLAFPDGERALGAEISLDQIGGLVSSLRMDRNETAFIVGPAGNLVASSSPRGEEEYSAAARSGATERMRAAGAAAGVLKFTGASGGEMVGAFHLLDNGWLVFLQQPAEDAYYTAARMRNIAAIAVCASLFLALLAGAAIARSIVGPVYRLVRGANEIGQGRIDYKVDVQSADEMGFLAKAFNRMSESLWNREKAIAGISGAARKISTMLNRDVLVDETLKVLNSISRSETVALMLRDEDSGETEVFFLSGDKKAGRNSLGAHLETAAARAVSEKTPIRLDSASEKQDGEDYDSIVIPLMYEEEAKGAVIIAGRTAKEPFTQTDLHLFDIVISSVAISLENIKLLKETIEKTRMEEELKTAELVQQTLFPEKAPDVPGLDLAGFIKSASETGGDWYGFVHEPENRRTAILIADVTGHGVPAALVTATTNSFFRTLEIFRAQSYVGNPRRRRHTDFDPLSPDFMLRCLNEIIYQSTRGRLVMTIFACVYDHDTQKLIFANAGHNMPMVYRPTGLPSNRKKQKKTGYLVARGMRLGETHDVRFTEKEFQLAPGDALLWISDGLIECENADGEEFGERRPKELFEKIAPLDTEKIKKRILEEAEGFFGGTPHKDDITFIAGKARPVKAAAVPAGEEAPGLAGKKVMIVNRDAGFCRQLSLFMKTRGAEDVRYLRGTAEAAGEIRREKFDICILPFGSSPAETELALEIKAGMPGAECIFITPGTFDSAIPTLLENGLPLRLVRAGSESMFGAIRVTALRLAGEPPRGIADHLDADTAINCLKVRDSHSRMQDIAPMISFLGGLDFSPYTINIVRTVADELLSNAIYDAPVDGNGARKYYATPRAERVILEDSEVPVLEFGCDARLIGIGVRDPFGTLTHDMVLQYLSKCIVNREKQYDDKPGGAGLGLYMLYRAAEHLVFILEPGRCCEVLCFINTRTDPGSDGTRIGSVTFVERKD